MKFVYGTGKYFDEIKKEEREEKIKDDNGFYNFFKENLFNNKN